MCPKQLAIHLGEALAKAHREEPKHLSARDLRVFQQGADALYERLAADLRFWLHVQGAGLADGEFEDIASGQYNASMHAAAKRIGAA